MPAGLALLATTSKKIAKGESVSENLNPVATQSQGFFLSDCRIAREDISVSVWQSATSSRVPFLTGAEGELVLVRVSAEPRALEELLDCLASVPFPINPQIYHGVPTVVEFPAWENKLHVVRDALRAYGFDAGSLKTRDMLAAITAA